MNNVIRLGRHGQDGYYLLADLPQRGSIASISLDTGWWELDQIFKIYPGQFTVVTGLAGSGKSTFLLNLICNLADKHDAKSFLYVPENEAHIRNKLEAIWGVRRGFERFTSEQCFIQSAAPEAYDTPAQTLKWILDMAVVAIERDGVDVLLIDPWNEIERAKPERQLMTDYIGECLMYLKGFCRKYEVAVILVAHPTKAGVEKGKIPSLSDIEGSMNWFNKCDNGLIVHRPDNGPSCQVISAKVRELGAGQRGVCYFMVDQASGQFTPQEGAVLT